MQHMSDRAKNEAEKKKLKQSFVWSLIFVSILWLIKIIETLLDINFSGFGVYPGEARGLIGILTAPLIHKDFRHLFSNSVPLIFLGTGILYLYRKASLRVFAWIYIFSGLGVWIFARPAFHIGASGLVYGYVLFIFFCGLLRKEPPAIALALIVTFLYGSIIWGVLPLDAELSWESHLSGSIIGIVCAIFYRKTDPPQSDVMEDDYEEYGDNDDYRH